MEDRAAKIPSKVIEAKIVSQIFGRRAGGYVDFIVGTDGVENVVAQEFKSGAVECFPSSAGYHVDRCAGIAPVFRREVGAFDRDFLDKINAHIIELSSVRARIHVEAAVNGKIVAIGATAIDAGGG